jgi:hypothetical protein
MKHCMRISLTMLVILITFLPNQITGEEVYAAGIGDTPVVLKGSGSRQSLEIVIEEVNCSVWSLCEQIPELKFSIANLEQSDAGYEMHVLVGDEEYVLEGTSTIMEMPFTSDGGDTVLYWIQSAAGAVLKSNKFLMRNMPVGDQYLFEALGDQWKEKTPGCAQVWNLFPPTDIIMSGWGQRIEDPADLDTSVDYTLLAGRLIWSGQVDADECADGGLLTNGAASQCGMETAREKVIEWQNKANSDIQKASLQALVPARLLKGMIGQESQFWPNWEFKDEYGLGMLTRDGVDMLLKWNESYYMEKCSEAYGKYYCSQGYSSLDDDDRELLIGYVMRDVGSDQEYRLLAETLYAGCNITSQIILNYTGMEARDVTDYETLWRITLGTYNSGCTCMGDAIWAAWEESERLSWESIASYLSGDCEGAADYFDLVENYGQ